MSSKKASAAANSTVGEQKPKRPFPTYPLSPSEIEIIVHIRWTGSALEPSSRAGDKAVGLSGDELQSFIQSIPFDPAYQPHDCRQVEINSNADDADWLLERAHRVQLVTADGSIPPVLTGDAWKAGKPGVRKPDGVGVLIHRPSF
jgi:hypothetical protein